jgi:hypothetical protein
MVLVALLIPFIAGFTVEPNVAAERVFLDEVEHGTSSDLSAELTATSSGDSIFIHMETYDPLILDNKFSSSEKKKDNSTQPMVFDIEVTQKKDPKTDLLSLSLLFLMVVMISLLAIHMRMHKKGEGRTPEKKNEPVKNQNANPHEKHAVSEPKEQPNRTEHELMSLPLALTVLDSIYQDHMSEDTMSMASMGPLRR